MNKSTLSPLLLLFFWAAFVCSCSKSQQFYTFDDWAKVPKIDAHFHCWNGNPGFVDFAAAYQFKLLSPNPDSGVDEINDELLAFTETVYRAHPTQFAFFSTFNASRFEESDFAEKTIAHLEKSRQNGAAGVKIWKNIGMTIRDKKGNWILPDHPAFDPVYSYLEQNNIPLMAHIGEPRDCWMPLDSMDAPNNVNYFREHPQYHMYLHPEMPSYEEQISARDNILKKHPNLRFIGAHLASEEWNVEKLAQTLDHNPGMKVDLSARILNLQTQSVKDYNKVRNFMINYADQLLYGSDAGVSRDDTIPARYSWVVKMWRNEWMYYATDSVFESESLNCRIKGLHLPKEVIDKIYYHNAEIYFNKSLKVIESVDFSHVKINDEFWSPRLQKHATATLPVCIDQIENRTGRIRNFESAANGTGGHSGIFFDDSDVYKALEGMAYSLINNPDPELEKKCDEWIDKIAAAQQPDGYLFTFYTITGIDQRWSDMDKHEMYCMGHLIEGAVAYYQATGKRKLLDVSIRVADHIMSIFGPGKRHWVPGHEEIELALVKLSQVTGEKKYLDFAHWLLEERGHGHGLFGDRRIVSYYQDSVPVAQLSTISGHAVRCMYLFCGMADVAALKNDTAYIAALNRVWDNVVFRNMYITGGIGSSKHNEGFTEDYDLPNAEAYCETCASAGMVFWNMRMNQFTGHSKYIDVLERSLYNGVLAGVNLEGNRFFYVNPLESDGNHHREEWYGCACCPSQVSRFLPSIGNYIYGISDDAIWVNLYIGNTTTIPCKNEDVRLAMHTGLPWSGNVEIKIESNIKKEIRLRIPEWSKGYGIKVNGKTENPVIDKGYAVVKREWKAGDQITLMFDILIDVVAADSRVKANTGKRALQRGPLVYCLEEVDNKGIYETAALTPQTTCKETFNPSLLGGVITIEAQTNGAIYNFIPYYSWDNREAGKMKVWVDYAE